MNRPSGSCSLTLNWIRRIASLWDLSLWPQAQKSDFNGKKFGEVFKWSPVMKSCESFLESFFFSKGENPGRSKIAVKCIFNEAKKSILWSRRGVIILKKIKRWNFRSRQSFKKLAGSNSGGEKVVYFDPDSISSSLFSLFRKNNRSAIEDFFCNAEFGLWETFWRKNWTVWPGFLLTVQWNCF